MAIKCSCKSVGCVGKVWFDGTHLWFTNDVLQKASPSEMCIYLDANGLVELSFGGNIYVHSIPLWACVAAIV